MSGVSHEASIAITNMLSAGKLEKPVAALLAWIEELLTESDELDLELARLRNIAEKAQEAVDYHDTGRDFNSTFDADIMISLMDDLDRALS